MSPHQRPGIAPANWCILSDAPRFIAAPHGTSSRRLLDEALTDVGLSPHIAVVPAQREAILPLVLAPLPKTFPIPIVVAQHIRGQRQSDK